MSVCEAKRVVSLLAEQNAHAGPAETTRRAGTAGSDFSLQSTPQGRTLTTVRTEHTK